jgi:hypothetical protein
MTKKKAYKTLMKSINVNEPIANSYNTTRIKIFNSFEEQEAYELKEMAKLSAIEILAQLRKLINIAYGMHGYNPNKLPTKHAIKIEQL